MDIEKIIAEAQRSASEIISASSEIRRDFEAGNPNSSTSATSEGAIRAMQMWMNADTKAVSAS